MSNDTDRVSTEELKRRALIAGVDANRPVAQLRVLFGDEGVYNDA